MKKKDLSAYNTANIPDGKNMRIGVVVSDWNPQVTQALLDGCLDTLKEHHVGEQNIRVVHVPGTYELPSGAGLFFQKGKFDGVICLGCVIKGETRHDEYINSAVANGLINLSLTVNKPVIFGVLTTENEQQALDRAGGKHGNKGTEAAVTAIRMVDLYKHFDDRKTQIGFLNLNE